MAHTPLPLNLFFLLTTLVAVYLIYKATNYSWVVLFGSIGWLVLQSIVGLSGFYTLSKALPPRFLLAIGPPVLAIVIFLVTAGGKRFLNSIDLKWAILLHSVRMLVEINLYFLYIYKTAAVQVSIEGGNIDFFAGMTAPIIWWAYNKGRVGRKGLLIWNFICLASLGNAVVRAIFSAPFSFQRFSFEQPTIAILYFPFILLPAFIVPCVLLSHVAVIRKLVRRHPTTDAPEPMA